MQGQVSMTQMLQKYRSVLQGPHCRSACDGDSGSPGGAQGTLPCWLGCVFRRALGSSRASFRSGIIVACPIFCTSDELV